MSSLRLLSSIDAPFIIFFPFLFNTTIEHQTLQIHNARLVCAKSQRSVCKIFSLSKDSVKRNISFTYCFYAVYTRAAKHNRRPHSAKHSQKWYGDEEFLYMKTANAQRCIPYDSTDFDQMLLTFPVASHPPLRLIPVKP